MTVAIRREASAAIRSAYERTKSYKKIHEIYGVGYPDGTNVRIYVDNPLTLEKAYHILLAELKAKEIFS